MPKLSSFYGIDIVMYPGDHLTHRLPHFHAIYADDRASYGIEPVEMLAGSLPIRQQRYVEEWAEQHQDELLKNWELLKAGKRHKKIDPLK